MTERQLWERYKKYLCVVESVGLTLDVSRMNFADDFLERMRGPMEKAFDAMAALEKGAIANPDEKRMVGHYWLRAPELAPEPGLTKEIRDTVAAVRAFADDVHAGRVKPPKADRFTRVLLVGMRMPTNLGKAYTEGFMANYRAVAEAHQVPLLPFLLEPIALDRDAYQADNIHPVAAVQPKLRDHVWPALAPLLK